MTGISRRRRPRARHLAPRRAPRRRLEPAGTAIFNGSPVRAASTTAADGVAAPNAVAMRSRDPAVAGVITVAPHARGNEDMWFVAALQDPLLRPPRLRAAAEAHGVLEGVDALVADALAHLLRRIGAVRPLQKGLAVDKRLDEHVARDEGLVRLGEGERRAGGGSAVEQRLARDRAQSNDLVCMRICKTT